jgi:hypothetical protein
MALLVSPLIPFGTCTRTYEGWQRQVYKGICWGMPAECDAATLTRKQERSLSLMGGSEERAGPRWTAHLFLFPTVKAAPAGDSLTCRVSPLALCSLIFLALYFRRTFPTSPPRCEDRKSVSGQHVPLTGHDHSLTA